MAPFSSLPCNHVPAKPPVSAYDKFVTIVVGPDGNETSYHLYSGLLCHYYAYFERMLNGSSVAETDSRFFHLEDVDGDAFRRFFYWLNTGELDCTDNGDGDTSIHKLWTNAINVYIFANLHQIPLLKNAVLSLLFLHVEKTRTIPPTISSLIYPNTTKDDSLRRFVVGFTSSMYEFEGWENTKAQDYDREFLFDVLGAVRDKVLGMRRFGDVCDELKELEGHLRETREVFCWRYHVHNKKE